MTEERERPEAEELLEEVLDLLDGLEIEAAPEAAEEGTAEEAPEGGEKAGEGNEPGEPEPRPPQPQTEEPKGEELLRRFAEDQEAQRIARERLAAYFAEVQAGEAAEQAQREIDSLIAEGRWEELGKLAAERIQRSRIEEEALSAARREAYVEVYRQLFAQPELREIPPEDRQRLAPANYPDDASYIAALTEYVVTRRAEAKAEAEAERKLREKLEAMGYEKALDATSRPSPSAIPPATEPGRWPSPEELIRQGWLDVLEERE